MNRQNQNYHNQQPQQYSNSSAYNQQHSSQTYGSQGYNSAAPPQIQNPFQPPSAAGAAGSYPSGYDADEAAQIAQWQSAYNSTPSTDPNDPAKQAAAAAAATTAATTAEQQLGDKKKTVMRSGGGKNWQDDTLAEWDPSHLRLFVGNLAGETTDDSLLKAFSRWKSVQKARVVRDKRSTKSKGYGFVSFSDADDFFKAAREMNGKYIQSHPVVVRKANTEIKVTTVKENKGGYHNNKHNKKGGKGGDHKSGSGSGAGKGGGDGYQPALGPQGYNGIVKPGKKNKDGLRIIG